MTLNKNTAQVVELFIHDFDYKKFDYSIYLFTSYLVRILRPC
jgi:hypothetical protein